MTNLNRLRELAGVPTADVSTPVSLEEAAKKGPMSYFLVKKATPESTLEDIMKKVDMSDLTTILRGAEENTPKKEDWQLFPISMERQATALANKRLEEAKASSSEEEEEVVGAKKPTKKALSALEHIVKHLDSEVEKYHKSRDRDLVSEYSKDAHVFHSILSNIKAGHLPAAREKFHSLGEVAKGYLNDNKLVPSAVTRKELHTLLSKKVEEENEENEEHVEDNEKSSDKSKMCNQCHEKPAMTSYGMCDDCHANFISDAEKDYASHDRESGTIGEGEDDIKTGKLTKLVKENHNITDVAKKVRKLISAADAAKVELDDGNIIDLLADNLEDESLSDLRDALVVAGFSERFPKATRNRNLKENKTITDNKEINEGKKELSVFDKHQLKVAKDILKAPDAMVPFMGGNITKEEAREIYKKLTGKNYKENIKEEHLSEIEKSSVNTKIFYHDGKPEDNWKDKGDISSSAKADNKEKEVKQDATTEYPAMSHGDEPGKETKVKIPASVKSTLNAEIKEAEKRVKQAKDREDEDSLSFYNELVSVLNNIKQHFEEGTVEAMKMAQVDLSKLMSPMLHMIPEEIVKFIARDGNKENFSLKNYFDEAKLKNPSVSGPDFSVSKEHSKGEKIAKQDNNQGGYESSNPKKMMKKISTKELKV